MLTAPGCAPAGRLLAPRPPGLRLLFQMITHTVPRSSKPPVTRLPHGQESCLGLFRGTADSLLLFPPFSAPPSLWLPLPPPSLLSSLHFFPSQALPPSFCFPFSSLSFPVLFSLEPLKQLCRKQFDAKLDAKGLPGTDMGEELFIPIVS